LTQSVLEIFEEGIKKLGRDISSVAMAVQDLAIELKKLNERVEKLEYTHRLRKCNPFEDSIISKKEEL